MKREESQALRGFAILGIVLHNYCHFLNFAVKENEYIFYGDRPRQFWDMLMSMDSQLFVHVFSFLGHYGVPVFLFVSGFGLVMKYEKDDICYNPFRWMGYHYLKLLRLMIIGYVVFIAVYSSRHPAEVTSAFSWDQVVAQLTMVINFVFKHPDKAILPGPYWFFGLMVQLYALYILVVRRWRSWKCVCLLIVLSWLLQMAAMYCYTTSPRLLNYIRYNFVGGVLPFCLGVLYARYGRDLRKMHYLLVVIVSAVAVLVGSLWFHTWLWVPLFVVAGALATVKLLPSWALGASAWMGGVSAALFVMHPVVREVVIAHYRKVDVGYGIAIYLLAAVALALLLQYVLKMIPQAKLKR